VNEHELPVSITLTVDDWREVIAGLTCQSFNGREQAKRLNERITAIVSAHVDEFRGTNKC
jgi:hypothetical protein